jgi:hypothetical protein
MNDIGTPFHAKILELKIEQKLWQNNQLLEPTTVLLSKVWIIRKLKLMEYGMDYKK